MSGWMTLAVIVKIAATMVLAWKTKEGTAFTIVNILTSKRLTPDDIGNDEKKATMAYGMLRTIQIVNWIAASFVAIAIWWQA